MAHHCALLADSFHVPHCSLMDQTRAIIVSKDLADKAIEMLRDQKAANPSRPWYMWFCPGANHAPHHAPAEYVEKYKGRFDDG
jgi:arylsulfatase A-like enzyme